MRQKVKNNLKKILFIAIVILILLTSITIVTKTKRNNKINNINQSAMGLYTTNVGEVPFDITNQVTDNPNSPKLSAGMIPIKYKDGFWQITTANDAEWYNNYNNGKMACIMLNDGVYQSELQVNMNNKKIATAGTQLQEDEMGTVFVWIPRAAYNEKGDILYLKDTSGIAGEYTTPEIFTYKASGVDKEDIALQGIWVEKNFGLINTVTAGTLNSENNNYGLIANTKAEYTRLDAIFANAINQSNETGMNNPTNNRMILKVVDEKTTEPIMAKLSSKGKKVTIEITKADNGIKEIRYIDGTKLDNFDGSQASYNVQNQGEHRFIIIDNIGNQRIYKVNVVAPEICVLTNTEDFIEFNGKRWYPSGTKVRIKYAENMSGITGYYQEMNGTYKSPVNWTIDSANQYRDFTLTETMIYKAKMENSMGEVLGEDEQIVHIMPTDTNIQSSYSSINNVGAMYPVKVTGTTGSNNTYYGTETYAVATPIKYTATHMGLINANEEKVLYIKIVLSPQGGYIGSTRNGVSTYSNTNNTRGYVFVTENGDEILLPKINEISTMEEENKITVTVDAQSYTPDKKIEKYYYQLDNGEYLESDSNEYVFENVQAYIGHSVRVYVKDSFGMISQIAYKYVNKTTNKIPVPTIEIVNKENLETIEYDGKIWYPYGTRLKVTNTEDMTNLRGYYKTIDETTKEESGWTGNNTSQNQSIYYINANQSSTFIAKIADATGDEVQSEPLTINILPYANGTIQTSYSQNIGAIYPVRVYGYSGTTTLYGLNTYTRTSAIWCAAKQMGLVKEGETKDLFIKITDVPLEGGYVAGTKNGITSNASSENITGYRFVTSDNNEEIKYPIIESRTFTTEEHNITLTINAVAYGSEIDKYYYSIDNGEYVESDSNICEYKDVQAYVSHTIKAYVVDKMGLKSEEITLTVDTKLMEKPELIISNQTPIEYDGKQWYPVNTSVRARFPEYNVSGLQGYFNGTYYTTQYSSWKAFTESGSTNAYVYNSGRKRYSYASLYIYIMANGESLQTNYRNNYGSIYPVRVTGTTTGTLYGSDYYRIDSSINKAATHMGLVKEGETKDLFIKVIQNHANSFTATTKNEITSTAYNYVYDAFVFVDVNGNEIISPILKNRTVARGESELTITTEFDYYSNATENKYYYSINGGEFIESNSNVHTFTDDVELYKNNEIKYYVKDSNGAESQIYTVSAKPTNEMQVPTFEVYSNGDTIEYNGETWYPYNTGITIKFAEDSTKMKNLTGVYKIIYNDSGTETDWQTTTNYIRNVQLSESITVKAKLRDATNVETEEVSYTVNNMNVTTNTGSLSYNNKVGNIYPVVVTGTTSGNLWGSGTYTHDSNISKAATHMGIVREGETRTIGIKVVKNPVMYTAKMKNKIQSTEYRWNNNGYVFVDNQGREIQTPTIDNIDVVRGESDVKITIDATGYNGASIKEYYYSVNNGGAYEQSTNNTITMATSSTPYNIRVYVKDSNGVYSEIAVVSNFYGYNVISKDNYAFYGNSYTTGSNSYSTVTPENTSIVNIASESYIELDLTKDYTTTDIVQVKLDYYYSFPYKNTGDYGYAIISETPNKPGISETVGRFIYVTPPSSSTGTSYGNSSSSIRVNGGKKYYIHLGMKKAAVSGYSIIQFTGITLTKTTSSASTNINTGAEKKGTITFTTSEEAVVYNGENWYPYGTKLNIGYSGCTTNSDLQFKYTNINLVTNATAQVSTYSITRNSTYTVTSPTVYVHTIYSAQIVDSSGKVIDEKTFKLNIMPNTTGYNATQETYWNDSHIGTIYPVKVAYASSGNVYGTNIYSVKNSRIDRSAMHMGLGYGKTMYIKVVPYPDGGYKNSQKNGITSYATTFSTAETVRNGFVFLDENFNEINVMNKGEVGATLSGYNVVNSTDTFCFRNEGTAIVPMNGGGISASGTTANSYIELDLTNYTIEDTIKITLNAEVSSRQNYDYGYATINQSTTAPVHTNESGRFVYISGTVGATDYTKIITGGRKYYLHLGYYKYNSTNTGQDLVKFNSLKVEKLNLEAPKIEISGTPIEYNNQLWYPYNTQVTITYTEGNTGYYWTNTYFGGTNIALTETTDTSVSFRLATSAFVYAGYAENSSQKNVRVNIIPYSSTQQYYFNYIGYNFPIRVSGVSSGGSNNIYGLGKYRYDVNINVAATQMGLVKPGESKILYVKTLRNPIFEGGRYNNITTSSYSNSNINADNAKGYVFIDEDGNEIIEPKDVAYATLSGYGVYRNNDSYYFQNTGEAEDDSIVSNNKSQRTTANSYIEIDLSKYTTQNNFRVVLNAEVSCYESYNYGFATITETKDAPAYSTAEGRIFYGTGTVEAKNYETILAGGTKYYLHLGYYRYYNNTPSGEDCVKFHSLTVTELEKTPEIRINSSAEPVEYDNKLWYPYSTRIEIPFRTESNFKPAKSSYYNYVSVYNQVTGKYEVNSQYIDNGLYTKWLYNTSAIYTRYNYNSLQKSEVINIMPYQYDGLKDNYKDKIGQIFPVKVRGYSNAEYLYGDSPYSTKSYINAAATHMGIVKVGEEKIVYVKIVNYPENGYKSSTRSDMTSKYDRTTDVGFVFVDEDGKELVAPIVSSVSSVESENSIFVTIDATGQNGANIEKYYYSIDQEEYIESTSNQYTFTDVEPYTAHDIRVYAKDNKGVVSDVKMLVLATTTVTSVPEIQIESDVEPVIYNDEEWYPYGTNITIKYADNMNNLTGHYKYIDERNGRNYQWTDTTEISTTIPLYYSATYIAKVSDGAGRETKEVLRKINIMPETEGEAGTTYYTDYVGNVYPVRVTGTTSGIVYGTDTYLNTSNINKAATHAGLVKVDENKVVYVKIAKSPSGGYIGNSRNSIGTSSNASQTDVNGFIFVDENGTEIKNPEINSLVYAAGENSITVTVNTDNSNIVKYYYRINDEEYVETKNNVHTFNNITTSVWQYICVYIEDAEGKQSIIKYLDAKMTTPVPTITFNQQPVVYNGENWYPYNTYITIRFANDMSNLKAYYRSINIHTKAISNWTLVNTSSNTKLSYYSTNLTESMIYEAYNYNSGIGEGEHLRETINIMPNASGLQASYYQNGSGKIYPVQVTGTKSGTIYGTDTYQYNSNINTAATHAGVVGIDETKIVYIKIVPCPEGGYIASTKNGITSSRSTNASMGFTFVQ